MPSAMGSMLQMVQVKMRDKVVDRLQDDYNAIDWSEVYNIQHPVLF